MRARQMTRVGAALVVGAIALSACSSSSTPAAQDSTGAGNDSSITVAWNQPFYSMNGNTSTGNATANNNLIYMMNTPFNYYDDQAQLQKNTDFGTYEKVSDDPLVVKYTIKDGVQWSDGTPVDAADMLLAWVANSGSENTPDYKPQTDADGNLIADPSGANVYFDGAIGAGLENVTKVPEISDDNKSLTLTYDNVYVDWELAFSVGMPAHIVAKKALGIDDPQQAKDALVKAVQDKDAPTLKKLADFWSTGYNFTSLPTDPDLYLSDGQYVMTDFKADDFLTMKKNDKFAWGPQPSIETVTIRFITDPNAAVTALKNGEVDVISPQPTADVRTAVDQLPDVTVSGTVDATYEHVDLQVANSKTPNVFADTRVREAFLKVIPRQEIIDKLITPLQPDAKVRDSFILSPDFPGYDDMVASNGMNAFDTVDVAGAKALLAEAGNTAPTVCLLYASTNPRRVSEFQLIQASAAMAGFNVTDCGSPDWSTLLGTKGAYDASLFGWQSTSTGVTSSKAIYSTGGINNFTFYSNPQVDALFKQLDTESDTGKQLDLQKQIEKILVDDNYGTVNFQFPGVTAVSNKVSGVSTAPLAPTIFWDFWNWKLS